jgi:hypothetical protein
MRPTSRGGASFSAGGAAAAANDIASARIPTPSAMGYFAAWE